MCDLFKDVIAGFIDLLYPPRCLICDRWVKKWLCDKCIYGIDDSPLPLCYNCKAEFPEIPDICPFCGSFDFICSLGYYEGVLKEAISKLKYGRKLVMGDILGELLTHKFLTYFNPRSIDIIVPVPLHPKRQKARGFNQLECIAKKLSKRASIKYSFDILEKVKDTGSQVSMPHNKRKKNLLGAFQVIKPDFIMDKNILLLDDVFTTGATIGECSRELLEAGAKRIYILVLALSQKSLCL